MFDSLSTRLQDVFKSLRGEVRLTEEHVETALHEIRLALLEADVNFKVVKAFIDRVRDHAMDQAVLKSLSPGQQVIKIVRDEMLALFGDAEGGLTKSAPRPRVVLLLGLQGSGKTTTVAALVDVINRRDAKHIVTIEDPIEYEHPHQRSVVEQVEIGIDAPDFPTALRSAVRQSPDVIVVGEMRDPETMRIALAAGETGHLVFSTLHTSDVTSTVSRVADAFPSERQPTIRQELSMALGAFLAGLIHDIGILVELQALREPLVEVAERASREDVRYIDLETQAMGVDHQSLGAALTMKWKFPRSFQYVTGHHHNPMNLAPECRWLTCIVHVADHMVTRENMGYSLTCKGEGLDQAVITELGLSMETLNELAKQLPEALKETEAMLS